MGNVSAKSRISLAQFDRWADIYTGKSGANNQPKTIVRLNKTQDKLIYVVKDKVYHALGRSEDAKRANDQVRQMFLDAVRDAFDGGPIPKSVMKVYNKSFFFSSRGCPLTARRIKAVVAAVKEAGGTLVEPTAPEPKKVDVPSTGPKEVEPPKDELKKADIPGTKPLEVKTGDSTEIKVTGTTSQKEQTKETRVDSSGPGSGEIHEEPKPEDIHGQPGAVHEQPAKVKEQPKEIHEEGNERPQPEDPFTKAQTSAKEFEKLDPSAGNRNDGKPPFLTKANEGGRTLVNLQAFTDPEVAVSKLRVDSNKAAADLKAEVTQFLNSIKDPLERHLNDLRSHAYATLGLTTDAQKAWFDSRYTGYSINNNQILNACEVLKKAMRSGAQISLKDFISELTEKGLAGTDYRNHKTGESKAFHLKDYKTLDDWNAATKAYRSEPWKIISDAIEDILALKDKVGPANEAFVAFKQSNGDLDKFRDDYLSHTHGALLNKLSVEDVTQLKKDIDTSILKAIRDNDSLFKTGRDISDAPVSSGCKDGPGFAEFVKGRIDRVISDGYTFDDMNHGLIKDNCFITVNQQHNLKPHEIITQAISSNSALKQCGGNSCFMISVVNGLLNSEKGRKILQQSITDKGCVFRNPSIAGEGSFTVSPNEIEALKNIFGKEKGMSELEIAIWGGLCKQAMLTDNLTHGETWNITDIGDLTKKAKSLYDQAKGNINFNGPGNQGVAADVASLFGFTKTESSGWHVDNTAQTALKHWVACKRIYDQGGIVIHHSGGAGGGHFRAVVDFTIDKGKHQQYRLAESISESSSVDAAASSINLKKKTKDEAGNSVEYFTYDGEI